MFACSLGILVGLMVLAGADELSVFCAALTFVLANTVLFYIFFR